MDENPYKSPATAQTKYATAPIPSEKMPGGIPYIIANEAAERFSFYGMKCILVIFMTQKLMGAHGLDVMSKEDALFWYHLFGAGVYFLPFFGAILSDAVLGKYRTILSLSLVYCLGHVALAMDDTRVGLLLGLVLISIGGGGIKSCVSAHVGDQFGATNKHLLEKVFGWFYFSINLGAFTSTILTPVLMARYGPHLAFGVPGILMALATLFFFMGRNKFVHIPPGGIGFFRETFSTEGFVAMAKLCTIYVFVAMFWALFDQTGSAWVLQAKDMNRLLFDFPLFHRLDAFLIGRGYWFAGFSQFEVLPSQIQAANPLLIMILIPIFAYGIYPLMNRLFRLTPLRKISIGMFVTVPAFAIPAWIEMRITAGAAPHIIWQIVAYIILTAAEVMISITCLEFSYTQAPKKMKSLVMGLFFMSVSLGNVFTAAVNYFIQNEDGTSKLPGASYYWFFTAAMLIVALLFVVVAAAYRTRTYIQDEQGSSQ